MALLRLALTCDDAPYSSDLGTTADAGLMDRTGKALSLAGVRHCMAFVVGADVADREPELVRWLDAGFELGNHSFDHRAASSGSVEEFLRDVERCDAVLERLGAFQNQSARWFRFPFLDRGRDPEARRAIQEGISALGYRQAYASIDLFDHQFEKLFNQTADPKRRRAIAARYVEVATESARLCSWAMARDEGPGSIGVPFFHVSEVSADALPAILNQLNARGAEWCRVEDAMAQPVFQRFDSDPERTGLVDGRVQHSLPWRAARRAARASLRLRALGQHEQGPRWPYF